VTQRVIQSIWMVLAALFIASSLYEGYLVLPGTHGHSLASLLARGFLVLAPLAAVLWGRQYGLRPRGPLFLLAGWLLVVVLTFWFVSPHTYYVEYYVWSQITGGLLVLTSWTLAGFPQTFRQTQIGALMLYGLAVVGVGLWEIHTGHHLGPSRVGPLSHIPTGFYYDQNSLGVAIALILPYILLLGGLWPDWPVYSLSALLAVLLAYILYKTGSRGGEIALLLDLGTLALVGPLSWRRLLRWLLGSLIGALILVIGILHTLPPTAHLPFALEKLSHLTHLVPHPHTGPSSVTIRLALYRSGWHAFITHPWGLGPRGAERYYAYWVHHKSPWNTYGVIDAHNMWLEIAMDFGVVGFLLYAGFYGWLLQGLMRLRPTGNRELEYFRAASLSSLVGFIVGSLSPSSVMIGFHIMWVIYGIALGTLVMAQRNPHPRLG